ncbi:MAG TPA: NAD(P)-binding protein [Terriglobia bacterium]|nr:NAD(P)-binding protein [Terriglobia bacterium]
MPVVIVGGGMAGLSAGWKLKKAGFHEFEILELEPECGGNSRFGENQVTAYPWGAHYVPLPTPESKAVRELFAELGIIQGYNPEGEPVYEEKYLCFSPQERLYRYGRWQEGLLPLLAVSKKDLEQYDRFRDLVADYRTRRGRDGRKAFSIPMEFSSRDREFLELDRISMREFLSSKRLDSAPLHWYVNYACRDDYGTEYSQVSAWAGIHYFASRGSESAAEIENSSVLTWPEGNGWLVKKLRSQLEKAIRPNSLVFHLVPGRGSVSVEYFDVRSQRSTRVEAEQVIVACPRQFARHLLSNSRDGAQGVEAFEYAPWMVANLSLRELPTERAGVPLAWDNVFYDSPSLGYVVATHQSLRTHLRESVFTYYYPLTGSPVRGERTRLLETDWRAWSQFILKDLSKPHPEIDRLITRLDIFRWGHGMVRPKAGFLWGAAREQAAEPVGQIRFAHSDLSGFSIFEEAQYRGVLAAEQTLEALRIPFTSSL